MGNKADGWTREASKDESPSLRLVPVAATFEPETEE
jgi:hypothetical protein